MRKGLAIGQPKAHGDAGCGDSQRKSLTVTVNQKIPRTPKRRCLHYLDGSSREIATMTDAKHEGRSIKLRSGQQADGTWVCEYTIIEPGRAPSTTTTGSPNISFSTREE